MGRTRYQMWQTERMENRASPGGEADKDLKRRERERARDERQKEGDAAFCWPTVVDSLCYWGR